MKEYKNKKQKNQKKRLGTIIFCFIILLLTAFFFFQKYKGIEKIALYHKESSAKDNTLALAGDKLNLNNFEANIPKDPEGRDQHFEKITTNNNDVFFNERKIDDAIVEKDQSVYVFDKSSGELKKKEVSYRPGLPEHLPSNLITQKKAESLVDGNSKFSKLYYASPDSDIFKINFDRSKPIWAVTSFDSNNIASITIIDATTGKKLGNGIAPPAASYSVSGPVDWSVPTCTYSYDGWSDDAANWFTKMGYTGINKACPSRAEIGAGIQDANNVLFYELAHGTSTEFQSSNPERTGETYASDISGWMANIPPKQFAFIGSCTGLCDTGYGSFSDAFRKGSNTNTTTVGYCGMSGSACGTCWGNSITWQDKLFDYMSKGYTVKAAFDQANVDIPSCGAYSCMRFAGDPNFKLNVTLDTQPPTVNITSPINGSTVSGSSVNLSANASDNVAVSKVEFYVDSSLVSTDTQSPYSFNWDATKVANGKHTLKVIATDTASLTGSQSIDFSVSNNTSIDTTPPAVQITSPPHLGSANHLHGSCNFTGTADGFNSSSYFLC